MHYIIYFLFFIFLFICLFWHRTRLEGLGGRCPQVPMNSRLLPELGNTGLKDRLVVCLVCLNLSKGRTPTPTPTPTHPSTHPSIIIRPACRPMIVPDRGSRGNVDSQAIGLQYYKMETYFASWSNLKPHAVTHTMVVFRIFTVVLNSVDILTLHGNPPPEPSSFLCVQY